MGRSVTVPMQAHDDVRECRLYGARQPKSGRRVTDDELTRIRQWLRSAQLVEEFLSSSNGTNDSENRIVIELIHGQPMRITPLTGDAIHLDDGGGAVRILKQADLRGLLDAL
ncbi:hypothetical protein NZD89_02185 [Alicyclobacillus fastidiosus]|uniref:Uncharacterized protein n=1 Tax=Alicyclobacillus fastidiosus TaxID=392011 RepID=A0ABY6ZHH6_9BACL|nr:hypothetical protein [Alicyclobacillus fastidiosus]WAH42338.1 hypothetical protein NZD89_02185 [Alicyclobacillus fastidiosus]GMA64147.1 hypothetical protein GCM10025859_45870 [Alicyclobacillus fastidiosus]